MDEIYTYAWSSDNVDEKQKYASTQIPSYAWEECIIQKRSEDGKIK